MKKEQLNPSRRKFVFSLASGAAAVAGYMLIPDNSTAPAIENLLPSQFPHLHADAIVNDSASSVSLGSGASRLTCSVNDLGMEIIKLLNGKRSLPQIASEISVSRSLDHNEMMELNLALFLVEVSKAGLLKQPFIVDIVERYTA